MKTKSLFLCGCIALLSITIVGAATAADTKIEQTLRDLDAQWSAAAGAKDLDKTVSFYSDDAIAMPPNASAARTKEAIRKLWRDLIASPGFVISWKATKIEVAKSGDLACLSGTYEFAMNDANGGESLPPRFFQIGFECGRNVFGLKGVEIQNIGDL